MAEKKKKTNPVVSYFKDVKGEMKKVAWPTFKQIKNNTAIVIVSVVIVGLVIALLDFGFGKDFEDGNMTLEALVDYAKANGEPKTTSGKQELYETILALRCK